MNISVVIPVYNGSPFIEKCVHSVKKQKYGNFEIIVVDDASTDNTFAILQNIKDIKIFKHIKNSGPAAARNTGIKKSRFNLIVFLDSDCFVENENWLLNYAEFYKNDKNSDKAAAGLVKGVYNSYGGGSFDFLNWFMYYIPREEIKDIHFPFANTALKRKIFEKTGLFDEEFKVLEDAEWCLRAKKQNIKFKLLKEAEVKHINKEGLITLWRHHFKMGLYSAFLRKKYFDAPYNFLFPKSLMGSLIKALPLTVLMTLYIVKASFSIYKVIYYIPGILWGNTAYSCGMIYFYLKKAV